MSPACRSRSSQEPKLVHPQSSWGDRNAAHSRSRPPPGGAGAGENPHIPVTSVVTPWRIFASADGYARRAKSEWACMSMKPGATTRPVASMARPASPPRSGAIAVMRSPVSPTSARRPGLPVPSSTVPPRISQSNAMARVSAPPAAPGTRRAGRDGQGLASSIFTLRILSPGWMRSTTSIPDVTWPNTV